MNDEVARVLDAALTAVARHHGQKRKKGESPYVLHPLRVARTVTTAPLPPGADRMTCVLAAVLHDTLEDTDLTREEIRAEYGEVVLGVVLELTQDKSLPKPERKALMIEHCPTMSPAAKVVKLADRLDNMREMGGMGPDFIERYCDEARRMLVGLAGACPPLEAGIREIIDRHTGEAGS